MAVRDVIVLDLPADFKAITQWNGRAGQDGQGGHAIIYAPDVVRIENVVDFDGDPVTGKRKMSEKTLAAWKEYRDGCSPVIIKYYNPGPMRCCREVVCAYYGEPCQKPANCCEAPGCHPGPPVDLDKLSSEYAKKLAKTHGTRSVQLAKENNDLPKYEREMIGIGLKCLMEWREDLWARHRGEAKLSNLDPPNFVITDHALNLLVSAIHQATSESRTLDILDQWMDISELDLSAEEKSSLIPVVCNSYWNAKCKHSRAWKKAETKMHTEACKRPQVQVTPEDEQSGFEPTRDPVVELMSAEVLGQRHVAGKRQIRLTAKAINADVYEDD
ncbi:uncharacterized protein EI90DRAFT_3011644 [Cantharellus anzutake]|uniref:uncharacterized protein n=1 Tax=Cantharellus anzutake TaxID=1750568 RepID=UPI001904B647|nr:uncharacterized protein EI90DRAFT_3011644 [Cantharellus anzutake]KAF8342094.1 hypothetical protein EI90DRAFT_3011644 [Cantharellus anzutake]